MENLRFVDRILWAAHPTIKGIQIKTLISAKEHSLNMTCMLVNIPAGIDAPEHVHDAQDDILFPLKGKGLMWVEGIGNISLEPGVIVRVPKGTKHKITEITEDLLLHDTFLPALF